MFRHFKPSLSQACGKCHESEALRPILCDAVRRYFENEITAIVLLKQEGYLLFRYHYSHIPSLIGWQPETLLILGGVPRRGQVDKGPALVLEQISPCLD